MFRVATQSYCLILFWSVAILPLASRPCVPPWSTHYDRWRKTDYCFTEGSNMMNPELPLSGTHGLKTYSEASQVCLGKDSKLATPHGYSSNGADAMFPWDGQDYWIGVKYNIYKSMYVYNDGVPMDTSWLSWSPWDTKGTEGPLPGSKNCVVSNNGRWKGVLCTASYRFICEFQHNCTDGWIYNPHVDRCNKGMRTKTSFEKATVECSLHGAIVETPRSPEAESFMFELTGGRNVTSAAPGIWLGIMNIADETTWVWNDGATGLTWKDWSDWDGLTDNEYGDRYGINCMFARTTIGPTASCGWPCRTWVPRTPAWVKTACHRQQMRYVCGKITCRFPYQSVVAEGHSPFYQKCYRPLFNERLNARQAGQFCAEDGSKSNPSKLAAPINQQEDEILHTPDEYLFDNKGLNEYTLKWIGYAYNEVINTFQRNDGDSSRNYERLNVLNTARLWAKLTMKCIRTTNNIRSFLYWRNTHCDNTYGLVCERYQPYVLTTCPAVTGLNASLLGGYYPPVPQSQRLKCYYRHTEVMSMTYSDADKFCASLGGYIMMPRQENDVTKAIQLISHSVSDVFWIGADDITSCYSFNFWCPVFHDQNFVYTDGPSFRSNNLTWHSGQPGDRETYVACIVAVRMRVQGDGMVTRLGTQDCFHQKKVVCQVDHNNLRAHRNFDGLIACKAGMRLYPASGDVCYHTSTVLATVSNMTGILCGGRNSLGSNSARPRNRYQMRSLFLSRPKGISTSLIGVFYDSGAMFQWLNGYKWFEGPYHPYQLQDWVTESEQNWSHGQRNSYTNETHKAVVMDKNGKWIRANQNVKHYASCEIPSLASLTTWRAATERSPEEASEGDRPHFENNLVAMVIVVSFVIM